ncbi:MAG: RdgB/HAM1 family non-canonical purine NTP pyrophosphatase [Kiritimatiellae bacterium]|nr:RdgB/HAM1 family non-canonical purine NTP pyrophosphatase [Kiritimatiellia bacterium]
MKLLLATRNANKVREIKEIFQSAEVTLVSADEVPGLPEDVEEDADTFEGNALEKARTLCAASGLWTLADDSGLEVRALNNEPGVHSARYAGEPTNTPANNAKLLRNLEGVTDRAARFRCAIALCAPDGREWTVQGSCPGRIIEEPRGATGFGYDPLFVPDGYDQTFAELGPEIKNRISHRARALQSAQQNWLPLLEPSKSGG